MLGARKNRKLPIFGKFWCDILQSIILKSKKTSCTFAVVPPQWGVAITIFTPTLLSLTGCTSGSELVRIAVVLLVHCCSHARPSPILYSRWRGSRPCVCGRHAWNGVPPGQPACCNGRPPRTPTGAPRETGRQSYKTSTAPMDVFLPAVRAPGLFYLRGLRGSHLLEAQLWSMVLNNGR